MRIETSLKIGIETHRLLEQFRLDLDETQETILNRVLSKLATERLGIILLDEEEVGAIPRPARPKNGATNEAPWEARGVRLPHGTKLRLVYKGKSHSGTVDNGQIRTNGTAFDTLSAAADKLTGVNLNGWIYWEAQLGENWVKLSDLRKKPR